jgi:hypothetical protein
MRRTLLVTAALSMTLCLIALAAYRTLLPSGRALPGADGEGRFPDS